MKIKESLINTVSVSVKCLLSLWYSIKETRGKKISRLFTRKKKRKNNNTNFKRNVLNITIGEKLLEMSFPAFAVKAPSDSKESP